ncbi:MAG: hypothetical protein HY730_00760 [Candidatus Tectomicrobia bacterium]|uniref:Uncharacterized protein n=1 Tax=Tectimicrobiota bacterium TaxID=2528274 RepID=A0A933GJ96_UNCTE|nr:hypothetical protein [Candidatus Tectomicrobia bacterium]
MTIELTKHIVAAKNIFFGTSYFLILPLPTGWRITRSYLEPDVHSSVQRENIHWVEAGQTDQVVFHPFRKIALDLMIRIKKGKQSPMDVKEVKINSQGPLLVNTHQAQYVMGEVKRGLIKKKMFKTLRLFFYCPEINSSYFLYFTGNCPDHDLMEIYGSLPGLECH